MGGLKVNIGMVLILVFVSVFYLGTVSAQTGYFISSEKIISSGTRCSDTGFQEVGTFPGGNGQILRHCVQSDGFRYSGLYVVNSYFEVYDGVDDCKDGSTVGSFNDISGEKIINLCVDRKTGDPPLTENMLISNVSIVNGSNPVSCPVGAYDTGISIPVLGGSVIHCASGGQAGGGRDSEIRDRCENYSGTINDISSECSYNLTPVEISGAGESLNGLLQSGPESCPQQLNCNCMAQGFSAYSGWNCTSIETTPVTEETCALTNARWTNLNLEDKSSANVGDNLSLVADVSDNCSVGRAVKCDIYKKVAELENRQFRAPSLNGEVNVTTNSNTKVAFCKWGANLFNDAENSSYYFNVWFSNNASSEIKSGDIEIKNETTEELSTIDEGNGNITWTTSTEYSKNRYCPQDQFIVRVIPGKIFCAQLNKSNGEPIVWGGDIREIGLLNTARGLKCEKNEGAVGIPKVLLFIPFNSFKCATMQDEEGVKVVGDENRVYRQKSSGCEYNEVISSMDVPGNMCWTNLRLTSEETASQTPPTSGVRRGLFGSNGLFGGLKNGPLEGILNGLLGNLGGILGIFR